MTHHHIFCACNSSVFQEKRTCTAFCSGLLLSNTRLFYLSLLPEIFQGFASLLVNLTVLEFICAQSPLAVGGLLLGVWYSLNSIRYLGMEIIDIYFITVNNTFQWTMAIYNGVKGFGIFGSLVLYVVVCKFYWYREKNEVMNCQILIEEQYERVIV